MDGPFKRLRYATIARQLVDALATHEQQARVTAASMHETRCHPIAVFEVNTYDGDSTESGLSDPFPEAFGTWHAFLAALGREEPGALEAAIEILSRIDPAAAFPIVRAIVASKPWPHMSSRAAAALARVDDPAAIELALAHLELQNLPRAIGWSCCPRAGALVLARLEASPALDVRVAKYDRGETMLVEELLAYLGKHRISMAWPLIVRLYREHRDHHVRLGCGHALVDFGDEPSLDLLRIYLDSDDERRRFFAVRASVMVNPARVVDTLGGLESLRVPGKCAIVSELFQEVSRNAREDGAQVADARLLDLALWWVKDRRVKDVAQWVLATFPKDVVAAAKKRIKRAGVAPRVAKRKKPTAAEVAEVRRRAGRRGPGRTDVPRSVAGGFPIRRVPRLGEFKRGPPRHGRSACRGL